MWYHWYYLHYHLSVRSIDFSTTKVKRNYFYFDAFTANKITIIIFALLRV